MSGVDLIERVLAAAVAQGGDRLELRPGRPPVLVRGGERLRAGTAGLDPGDLDAWLRGVATGEQLLPVELGGEARLPLERAGRSLTVVARRAGGAVSIDVLLRDQSPSGTRSAPRAAAPRPEPRPLPEARRPIDRLLLAMVELEASDLHLSADVVPMVRVHGTMQPLGDLAPLGSDHILLMCEEITPAHNRREFRETSDTDFAYEIPGVARFRVNLFRDRRGVCAVFRQIPTEILTMEQLGLPDCVRNLCALTKGLVVVTGPTGSGKSTTLAAMIDHINETRTDHVITIEDPIEFVHPNKRCLINQREVHSHTGSFKRALRAALREDPDIVLVGEMRDLETIAIAIETAETGHLVFGTLHTTTAVSTVDRIIDQFPADRQEQVRMMLADSLKGVIAQTLCRRIEGGRVAAFEILLGIPAVANLIREGKTHQIASVMQTSRKIGMRTLNDSLAELVNRGIIDRNEALLRAVDKDGLRAMLDRPTRPPSTAG